MKGSVIIGGVVIALGVAAYFLSRKKSNNVSTGGYCKLTPVAKVDKKEDVAFERIPVQESPADEFFNNAVEKYRKKLLSYCILNVAEEAGFTAEQQLKLTDKYGMVSLMPMLSAELSGIKEAGLRHADIDKAAANWLLKHGGKREGIDDIDSIEIILKKEIQQNAVEIIKTLNS